MSTLDLALELTTTDTQVGELVAANDEIAELHLLVVGRAIRLVDQAMRTRSTEAAHAITTTATLVPELSERIADAIGGHLTARWGLEIGVDAFTAAELDLAVRGPFERSQLHTLVAFIEGVAWWPSRVSIMFDRIMAIDASMAARPERLSATVEALVAGPPPSP